MEITSSMSNNNIVIAVLDRIGFKFNLIFQSGRAAEHEITLRLMIEIASNSNEMLKSCRSYIGLIDDRVDGESARC